MLETRPEREAEFDSFEYEIEYGEPSMTWMDSMAVRIAALTAAALALGIALGVMVSQLTDDDAISAELPSPPTTAPAVEQDPGLSDALTADQALADAELLVVGGPDAGRTDEQSSTTEATTSTTAADNSAADSNTSTSASTDTSAVTGTGDASQATTTTPQSTTAAERQTTSSTERRTTSTSPASQPVNNNTTTTMAMNPGNDGGSPTAGGDNGGSPGTDHGTDHGSQGDDAGHDSGGHDSHGGPGQWVKASSESANYPDRPIATTHHIFNPYSSNAPAGWGASRIGFLVHCEPVMVAQIDPIVAPGAAKSAHLHEFFGNPNVTPNSTTQSLANTPTSQIDCTDKNDKSGYWTPTAYQNGRQIRADRFKAYYKSPLPNTVPMPFGLRMVAGDATATKNQPRNVGWWQTTESITTAGKNSMVSRGGAKNVRLRINFPNCWDGVHLDSPDHQSHVAYASGNRCPSSHPVAIPQVVTFTDYTAAGGSGFSLASGPWYTFHQDFWNVWSPDQMEELHARCNLAEMNCRARSSPDLVPRGQKAVKIEG